MFDTHEKWLHSFHGSQRVGPVYTTLAWLLPQRWHCTGGRWHTSLRYADTARSTNHTAAPAGEQTEDSAAAAATACCRRSPLARSPRSLPHSRWGTQRPWRAPPRWWTWTCACGAARSTWVRAKPPSPALPPHRPASRPPRATPTAHAQKHPHTHAQKHPHTHTRTRARARAHTE